MDEGTKNLTEAEMEKLHALGIQSDLIGKEGYSWCAVVDPKSGVSEKISKKKAVSSSGPLVTTMHNYSIKSAGSNTDSPSCSIVIDNIEYASKTKGINIVVWDNVGRSVIDSVAFDTGDKSQSTRSWFIDLKKKKAISANETRW